MNIHIIQHGTDGFGHQLEGFFTCLIMHNVGKYYFDGFAFREKLFRFEHVDDIQARDLQVYLQEISTNFINDCAILQKKYDAIVHSHEIHKIPKDSKDSILYSLDNVFYFHRIFISTQQKEKIYKNIAQMKSYFINTRLPPNRLPENNIVIHVRLGDALIHGRGGTIQRYSTQILQLIDIFKRIYPDHTYYIHSDGEPTDILHTIHQNYIFYNKDTPVLESLSDFIHAKIFVCGVSSLSKVCTHLGKKDLVIVEDSDDRIIRTTNVFTISNYLSLNTQKPNKG